MPRIIASLLFAGFLFLATAHSNAQEQPTLPAISGKEIDANLGSDWYGVYLQGKKIGYAHQQLKRVGDHVEETMTMSMKLVSFMQKIEMKVTQTLTFESKSPFRLMKVTAEENLGAGITNTRVERTDKGFNHLIITGKQQRATSVDDVGITLADSLGLDLWVQSNPAVGKQLITRSIEAKDWKVDSTLHMVKAIKSSLVNGVNVKFTEVESDSKRTKLKYLQRIGADGKVISTQIAIFELRRETEAEAKNNEFSRDLFVLGMAKADKKIGYAPAVRELIVEVDAREGEVFKNGPRQTVVVKENGTRLIKLGKKFGNPVKVDDKTAKENLAETADYLLNDSKVIAMAKEAVGDAKTPEEKVKNIVAFVHRFIRPKMVASLPSLPDLLEKKVGDCKCYALLTTTLCRAAGIPSREVAGLVYMGDDVQAFGGHAWNEVVLGGVWVPVDASLNQIEVDAGHISQGEKSVASGNVLQSLGKISFRVIESQTSP